MPEISRFLGIVIARYYNDHAPAHFHAKYGGYEIKLDIDTGEILEGSFPKRALRLVKEWNGLHRDELKENWARASNREPLKKVEPLE